MQGTPKAIEIKGIVRNATVIGAQDGQAEDLINLRFMDGSWRASGDGRLIDFTMGAEYTQLFIHTNVYRHLLGVRNVDGVDKLFWFASIDTDGVTFRPLKSGNSSSEDTFIKTLPDAPFELTTVHGDLWITQTGHLLTIIDGEDDFEYFVYNEATKTYKEVQLELNASPQDRTIYPLQNVHVNFYSDASFLFHYHIYSLGISSPTSGFAQQLDIKYHPYASIQQGTTSDDFDTYKNRIKIAKAELQSKNKFTGAMLVSVAIKLYDGTYTFASNPVLIYPRKQSFDKRFYFDMGQSGDLSVKDITEMPNWDYIINHYSETSLADGGADADGKITRLYYEVPPEGEIGRYSQAGYPYIRQFTRFGNSNIQMGNEAYKFEPKVNDEYVDVLPPIFYATELTSANGIVGVYVIALGYDLVLSIKDFEFIKKNKDIFSSLCVFVTSEADITRENDDVPSFTNELFVDREPEKVINNLKKSPMFLLKEYKVEDFAVLENNPIIDLSKAEDEGLLQQGNITQQKRLSYEAFARTTYLPKYTYQYNNRLHIANYKAFLYYGYPIDQFHLHNHSVKVLENSWFKGVLPNLSGNSDDYLQYPNSQVAIKNTSTLGDGGALVNASCPYFIVKVHVETSTNLNSVVCRYIPAYDYSSSVNGRADFIEDLNPLLTYPDSRAKKMEIYYIDHYNAATSGMGSLTAIEGYYVKHKVFDLKPHPYLNLAYYIDPELKPIKLSEFDSWPLIQEIGG